MSSSVATAFWISRQEAEFFPKAGLNSMHVAKAQNSESPVAAGDSLTG
jgi:hypothetical protein